MKVAYIQWAGDFGKTYHHFKGGGSEDYYGQTYSVEAVVSQARSGISVFVVVCKSTESYLEELEVNLTAAGIGPEVDNWRSAVLAHISKFRPDKVILRIPDWKILRFLRKRNIAVFPVLADSFEFSGGAWGRISRLLLARELKHSSIQWIANHQLNASLSIHKLGIDSANILPYDWEHEQAPSDWAPGIRSEMVKGAINLFYAGSITESKGIFDIIEAIKSIRDKGRSAFLRVAGAGEIDKAKTLAEAQGVEEQITFLGKIDHGQVLNEMNKADVVLVPSHHIYPEGLPMTVMESLLVHTPVIVSDHPMFVGRLITGQAVEMFPEKDVGKLSSKILDICGDSEDYQKRCDSTTAEWERLTLDLKWADMINRWLINPDDPYLLKHTLKALETSATSS